MPDFFNQDCQSQPIMADEFGLCDNENGNVAYTAIDNRQNWIATVKNETVPRGNILFTAVDHCVIADNEEHGRGRCDGMLTFDEALYFVELKNQRTGGWISDSISQLRSTIEIFYENHPARTFRYKKAFACNKRHPYFHDIDNEANLRFLRETGFRLDIQSEIVIR